MFSWNLAKSAEAVFPRWAVKRLLKFFLKKKLGEFILGDIDLDQLDVQLRQGTIQLNDLAFNVDYLNDKFGSATPIIIKEGSIGSLSVTMPWKDKGFQVEVDELEIVLTLASCLRDKSPTGDEKNLTNQDSTFPKQCEEVKHGHDMKDSDAKSGAADVHEGVKTIAKMVKWFLTSFHVKVKNLIIAFEPDLRDKQVGCQKILVLRISKAECGTCVSEDSKSNCDARAEDFLGISQLTNFIKFQGAVLELLNTDNVNIETCVVGAMGSCFSDLFSGNCPSNATIPIMTSNKDGFSGNLKLSIPWKNGFLDIRQVDANVSVDPVELRLQPNAIKWFLLVWGTYKTLDEEMHNELAGPVDSNLASHLQSSTVVPAMVVTDKAIPVHGSFISGFSSLTLQGSGSEAMLPGSHLIPDWVPNSIKESGSEDELDLGASVDQFFECFDEMRSSQLSLGSSGMWNWTCSVFSALTAASNLASGSLHIPSVQQHVQTNLQATLAGISIFLYFQDEDPEYWCNPKGDQSRNGSNVHFMAIECSDIFVALQVCPQKMIFKGKVKHVEIADYSFFGSEAINPGLNGNISDSISQTLLLQYLQDEVQGVLPPFVSFVKNSGSDEFSRSSSDSAFRNMTKMKLLSTSGVTHCQFAMSSNTMDGRGTTSFSLDLPHFIFWVNFWSVNALLDLVKDSGKYAEMNSEISESSPVNQKHRYSPGDTKKNLSSTESLKGNISLLDARMILCLPFRTVKDTGSHFSWNQFIVIDVFSKSTPEKGKIQSNDLLSDAGSAKRYTLKATRSLHWNVGDFKVYLVSQTCRSDAVINSYGLPRQKFYAENILSVSSRMGCPPTFSMLWQEGSVTGPWIFRRAKSLATSEELKSRKKTSVKGFEFASVTSAKDMGVKTSQTREEMISSAAFFLHVHLLSVTLDLCSSQYHNLHNILEQITHGLLGAAHTAENAGDALSLSQTSILLECESVEILIRPDVKEDTKNSLQNELPGSWNCIKLEVQKLDLLSVSNVGGIGGANLFWLAHGEGKVWGSTTGVPGQEFVLISCSNSTRKRGDGGGSNELSSTLAGSDVVHLWDPENFHEYTSVTVGCGTMMAVGGRLDWFDAITSFFNLSSHEVMKVNDDNLLKEDVRNAPCGTTFVLKLVDIGLSYEPCLKSSVTTDLHSGSSSPIFKEEIGEPPVACLLAASSLTLFNTTTEESTANDYKVRVQELGLLLCAAFENLGGTYSVENLQEMGYVKVAREALLEAILRTNCKNGLEWELECSESHIYVESCHDTTSGLMLLAAQLQQLFAPDLEESIVHLQTRWNNIHRIQKGNEFIDVGTTYNNSSSISQEHASCVDRNNELGVVGLMDEIHEDAFCLHGSQDYYLDSDESRVGVSFEDNLLGEACCLSIGTPEIISDDLSYDRSVPLMGLESSVTSYLQNGTLPELIEGYCLPDLRPLSELSMARQSASLNLKCQSRSSVEQDLGRANSGWYKDASVSIVENHIPEERGKASLNQVLEDELQPFDHVGSDDFGKPIGRILLKSITVNWRMFAGSDWHEHEKNEEATRDVHGRDLTAYLEFVFSGTQFQYNFFPVDGVCASKLSLSVKDFYLYDRSKSAPWTRVLGYYRSKEHPRESSSKALRLELEAVRPNPLIPLEEYRLRVALLPVLLQLHQSQLDFLTSFFGGERLSTDQYSDHSQNVYGAKPSAVKNLAGHIIADEALLPYFQMFDIWPLVLRVDYSPRHVDLAALGGGKYVELMNLIPWKGVELQLKHVHAVGVYGWGNVCGTIIGEWLEDVSQNQMHKVLRGLPPIRSLIAVGSGAAKLVSLPVESYRKDQRVLKGMQRGTIAFLRSISLEAVGLGLHLAASAHDILVQAEYILTGVPSPVSWSAEGDTKPNVRGNQPKNAKQGIRQAYESLSDGLGKSASAIVQTPLKKYQRGASAGSALATAVRSVPAAAIAPVSACASAAHYALLGLRNSLDPEHKKESMDKYLGPSSPRDLN